MKRTAPTTKRKLSTGRFLLATDCIAVFAFLLRLIMFSEVIGTDPFVSAPSSITDMATYHQISDGILQGHFPAEFVYQPFYYAVFLPIAKFIFQSKFWSIGIAQAICVAGIIRFAALSAAMLRSRRAGLITALLCAFSTHLFFYVPYALIEIQQCLWFTLLFYSMLRMRSTGKTTFFVASGLFLSFAILSRGNAWCFLPLLICAVYCTVRKFRISAKQTILKTAILIACILLPQAPFAIRNTIHTHSLSGPANAGPAVLTIGNNPEAAPGTLVVPYPATYEAWMAHQDVRSIPGRIFDWFRENPPEFLVHQAEKVWLFFDWHELYNNINPLYNATRSIIFKVFGIIPTGLLIWLSFCAGIHALLVKMHHKNELLLHASILLYALATAAFYILARFRVPAIGLFAIGAGMWICDVGSILRKKDMHTIIRRMLLPFATASVACFAFFPVYRDTYEPCIRRLVSPHGIKLVTDSETRIHDNAPFYNASWLSCNLTPATSVVKQFDFTGIPKDRYQQAYLNITFTAEKSGILDIICNGRQCRAHIQYTGKRGEVTPTPTEIGPFPIPDDGVFTMSFAAQQNAELPGLAVDLHRNYGRTVIDNQPFPAEAVIELILK